MMVSCESRFQDKSVLTIMQPFKAGFMQLASFHLLGPVCPIPNVLYMPFLIASSPAVYDASVSSCFTEEKQSSTSGIVRSTIVGGFGRHIRKVDTLTKHISGGRSFRWGNPETLTQNTTIVGNTGSVPE